MDSPINTKALSNTPKTHCISCNQDLGNTTTTSIHEMLPHIEPATTFFEGLKQLSDFRNFSIDQVPPRGCKTCFLKTSGCLRFISLCNKSAFIIEGFNLNQEETKQDVIDTDMSEACVESNNSYRIEPNVEPTQSIDIKEEHLPQENHIFDTNISNSDKQCAVRRRILIKRKRTQKKRNEPDQEKVECKTCNKWFTKNYIKYHERLHTGGEFYRCTICDKAFTMPSNYYSHMHHCHRKDCPFLCNLCGRGFKRGYVFRQHIKVQHNKERPYECKTCGKKFTSSTVLRDHASTHSDERPFQCDKCPKQFSLRKFLRQHAVTHAEVRPIACEYCDKRFTQRHCLRSHQAKTCEGLRGRDRPEGAEDE